VERLTQEISEEFKLSKLSLHTVVSFLSRVISYDQVYSPYTPAILASLSSNGSAAMRETERNASPLSAASSTTLASYLIAYARQINTIAQNLVMVVYSDLLLVSNEAVGARPAANNTGFDVISVSGEVLVDAQCMSAMQRMVHHTRLFFEHHMEIESTSNGAQASSFAGAAAGAGAGAGGIGMMDRGVSGVVGEYLGDTEKDVDADGAITTLAQIQGILSNLLQLQT
jgi:hypothetical protein